MNGMNPFTTFDERATTWGAKEWMAQRVDTLGNKINTLNKRVLNETGRSPSNLQQFFKMQHAQSPNMTDILHPSQYKKQVSKNFKHIRISLKNGSFGEGYSLGRLAKGVLIDDNIQPIQKMTQGNMSYLGSGLIRLLGLGYIGFDTAKKTKESCQHNGTISAIQTFIKEGFKNIATWQAAGFGFMFGKALLPAIGRFPLGGIVAGTVSAIAVGASLDKILKEKEFNIPYTKPVKYSQSQKLSYLG